MRNQPSGPNKPTKIKEKSFWEGTGALNRERWKINAKALLPDGRENM